MSNYDGNVGPELSRDDCVNSARREKLTAAISSLGAAKQKAPMLVADLLNFAARQGMSEMETVALMGALAALLSMKTLGCYERFEREFDDRLIRRLLDQNCPVSKILSPVQSELRS